MHWRANPWFYPGWPTTVKGHKNWLVRWRLICLCKPSGIQANKTKSWWIEAWTSTPDAKDSHPPIGHAHGGRTLAHWYRSQRGRRKGTPMFYLDGMMDEVRMIMCHSEASQNWLRQSHDACQEGLRKDNVVESLEYCLLQDCVKCFGISTKQL